MPRSRVNKKHLAIELTVVFGIILAAFLWRFLPWFFSQPLPSTDQYAEYKKLYNEVIAYDFSKGRNADLETRIARAIENSESASFTNQYFKFKAQIEYSRRAKDYSTMFTTLNKALAYAPDLNELNYLYKTGAEVSEELGKTEQAAEYRSMMNYLE